MLAKQAEIPLKSTYCLKFHFDASGCMNPLKGLPDLVTL